MPAAQVSRRGVEETHLNTYKIFPTKAKDERLKLKMAVLLDRELDFHTVTITGRRISYIRIDGSKLLSDIREFQQQQLR